MEFTNTAILTLVEKLKAYSPQKVILFGSQVSGQISTDSDIDLAIIKDTSLPFYKRSRDVRKLLRSRHPIDVFVFTPQEFNEAQSHNPIVAQIAKTGKVVYEQTT